MATCASPIVLLAETTPSSLLVPASYVLYVLDLGSTEPYCTATGTISPTKCECFVYVT